MNGASNNKQLDVCIIKVEHIKKLLIKNKKIVIAINITYNHPALQCLICQNKGTGAKMFGETTGGQGNICKCLYKNQLLCISEPCILYYF